MTVSARDALVAASEGRSALRAGQDGVRAGQVGVHTGQVRASQDEVLYPKKIDVNDPGQAITVLFVQEVQEVFSRVEPEYAAPMNAIFEVAKRHALVATIDHCDEDYWTEKKQAQLLADEELDGPFEVELFALTAKGTKTAAKFKLAWTDLRKVALVVPKIKRRK